MFEPAADSQLSDAMARALQRCYLRAAQRGRAIRLALLGAQAGIGSELSAGESPVFEGLEVDRRPDDPIDRQPEDVRGELKPQLLD